MNKKDQLRVEKMLGYERAKKEHKYGATRQSCNLGHQHPSLSEATHCWALQAQMKANLITDLKYEPSFDLKVNEILICTHRPDFSYLRKRVECRAVKLKIYVETFDHCVDEVKGFKTPDWKLKSALFKALYPDIQYRVL